MTHPWLIPDSRTCATWLLAWLDVAALHFLGSESPHPFLSSLSSDVHDMTLWRIHNSWIHEYLNTWHASICLPQRQHPSLSSQTPTTCDTTHPSTHLLNMCDKTHFWTGRSSTPFFGIRVTQPLFRVVLWHMRHDSSMTYPWLKNMCDMTPCVSRRSSTPFFGFCVTQPLFRVGPLTCMTWLTRDSWTCATWLIVWFDVAERHVLDCGCAAPCSSRTVDMHAMNDMNDMTHSRHMNIWICDVTHLATRRAALSIYRWIYVLHM